MGRKEVKVRGVCCRLRGVSVCECVCACERVLLHVSECQIICACVHVRACVGVHVWECMCVSPSCRAREARAAWNHPMFFE